MTNKNKSNFPTKKPANLRIQRCETGFIALETSTGRKWAFTNAIALSNFVQKWGQLKHD